MEKAKLWIDDIRKAPSDDWTVAKTVISAIRAIEQFDFDEISLDHDISHQVVVGSNSRPYPCEECFCSVVFYIAEKYYTEDIPEDTESVFMQPKLTIHTSNPVAANEMKSIFDRYRLISEIKLTGISNRLEMEV